MMNELEKLAKEMSVILIFGIHEKLDHLYRDISVLDFEEKEILIEHEVTLRSIHNFLSVMKMEVEKQLDRVKLTPGS